jgi:hypothetical protein
VPPWLTNLEAFGWRLLVIGALAVFLAWISLVLIAETASLVLSAVIAEAAAPLVISLRARGWSRVRAALGAWAVVGAIIVGALVLAVIAFVFYGLLLALVWVMLSAVDVALTGEEESKRRRRRLEPDDPLPDAIGKPDLIEQRRRSRVKQFAVERGKSEGFFGTAGQQAVRFDGDRCRGSDDRLEVGPLLEGDFEAFFLHFENGEIILSHQSDEFFDVF